MRLDAILERNQAFLRGREARPLPPPEQIHLAVVGCYDPRLDDLLLSALALAPGDAFLLRSAGARLAPGGDALRSLGLAAFLFDITEILVVGHTSCRMAMFETNAFIDAFRRRGLNREAFGTQDLRVWAGAIASPRAGVLESVAAIHAASFLPKDISVSGLVLNDESGALEVIVRAGEIPAGGAVAAAPAEPAPIPEPSAPPPRRERPISVPAAAATAAAATIAGGVASVGVPAVGGTASTGGEPAPVAPRFDDRQINSPEVRELLGSLGKMLQQFEWKGRWREEVQTLRQQLSQTANPFKRLQLLEDFYRRAAAESREVAAAYQEVRRHAAGVKGAPAAQSLGEILRVLTGGRK